MKNHRHLEHGALVLSIWLLSVLLFIARVCNWSCFPNLVIASSLSGQSVSLWHLLAPNPEVPSQSLLLRLPLASADSSPMPRSDINHLGKPRKANPWALAPQQHQTTGGIKVCVAQEELKDCVFVNLRRESGPTASSLYLPHNWSPASTPQSREGQWGATHLTNMFLPSHHPLPGLRKRWALLFIFLHSIPVENKALGSWDGRVLFLLQDSLGLVPDMLKGKKQRHLGNIIFQSSNSTITEGVWSSESSGI